MQELIEWTNQYEGKMISADQVVLKAYKILEKEKDQIQKAFSDGQETPINHPTLPHYSREEYYSDNYNENQ